MRHNNFQKEKIKRYKMKHRFNNSKKKERQIMKNIQTLEEKETKKSFLEELGFYDEPEESELQINETIDVDKYLKKLRKFDKKIDERKKYRDQVNNLVKFHIDIIEEQKQYYETALKQYLLESEQKTIQVVEGTIRTRSQDKYHYPEDFDPIPFAEDNCPEIVQIKKSVLLNDLKKYIKDTGNIPEGVEIKKEDSFSYKLRDV